MGWNNSKTLICYLSDFVFRLVIKTTKTTSNCKFKKKKEKRENQNQIPAPLKK